MLGSWELREAILGPCKIRISDPYRAFMERNLFCGYFESSNNANADFLLKAVGHDIM